VANLHKLSDNDDAVPIRKDFERPLKVDANTVKAACPKVTNLHDLGMAAKAFTVSPDGTMIALLNKKAPRVRINDASGTGNLVTFEGHSASHLEWSPDSKRFALAEPAEKGAKTRILFAELPSKATKEVMLDAPVARLRFSWDGATLYAFSNSGDKLLSVDPASGAVKTVFSRPGLHWFLPGPKWLFLADETSYYLVDPSKPDAPRTIYSPKDRGRVLNTEWTADGKALFLFHADTTQACKRGGKVLANDHQRLELLRVDAESGAAKMLFEESRTDSFVHSIWRSPDGSKVAALGQAALRVYDSAGNRLYKTAGGDSMRWARDGRALLMTVGDEVLSLDVRDWNERLVSKGIPYDSKMGSAELHFVDPDYLGGKLLYTMIRVAGKEEYE
jgi:WD40 repeat protein